MDSHQSGEFDVDFPFLGAKWGTQFCANAKFLVDNSAPWHKKVAEIIAMCYYSINGCTIFFVFRAFTYIEVANCLIVTQLNMTPYVHKSYITNP